MEIVIEFFKANESAQKCWVALGKPFGDKEEAITYCAGTKAWPEEWNKEGLKLADNHELLEKVGRLERDLEAARKELGEKNDLINRLGGKEAENKTIKKLQDELAALNGENKSLQLKLQELTDADG